MKLHEITPTRGRRQSRRVGRGIASGHGKTAGRGTKGQKSRSGFNVPRRFEGGQTPLVQRLPKSGGFTMKVVETPVVPVAQVNRSFKEGERLSPKTLAQKGLLSYVPPKVKLVGPGKLEKFLRLERVFLTTRLKNSLPQAPTKKRAEDSKGSKVEKRAVAPMPKRERRATKKKR